MSVILSIVALLKMSMDRSDLLFWSAEVACFMNCMIYEVNLKKMFIFWGVEYAALVCCSYLLWCLLSVYFTLL